MLQKLSSRLLPGFFVIIIHSITGAADSVYYELWDVNSLQSIGGHALTVKGNPEVVSTEHGEAVKFDGDGDMLLIDKNPLDNAKAFTAEVVFKPDAGVNIKNAPRFIHMGSVGGDRLMIELRVNKQNQWYLDGYLKTDKGGLVLIDDTKTHPTGEWVHAAVTYANSTMKTYVNGKEELSGQVEFSEYIVKPGAKTSIGARQNEKSYYSGLIKYLKITHAGIGPDEFIFINGKPTTASFSLLRGNIKIHPEPANGYIHISAEGMNNSNTAAVYISNPLGEIVFQTRSVLNNSINTSEFQNGLYFILVKMPNYSISQKIAIQH